MEAGVSLCCLAPLQSLEQSCSCRQLSTRCPPPLCINTTTFFHDPIPSLGGGPRHPLLWPGPPACSPGGNGRLGFPGLLPPLGESRPLSLHLPSPCALPLPHWPQGGAVPRRQAGNASGMCVGIGGHGEGGAEGELEVPVGWLSEPGVGVCRDGGVCPVLPTRLQATACVCICVCESGCLFGIPKLQDPSHTASCPLSSLFLPPGNETLPVVLNPKSASKQ